MTVNAYLAVIPVFIKDLAQQETYQRYIAEALRLTCESAANLARGSFIKKRYEDIINPPPEDSRTGEEVIEHMKKKLKGGIA